MYTIGNTTYYNINGATGLPQEVGTLLTTMALCQDPAPLLGTRRITESMVCPAHQTGSATALTTTVE